MDISDTRSTDDLHAGDPHGDHNETELEDQQGLFERLKVALTGGEYSVHLVNYFLVGGIVSMSVAAFFIQQQLLYIDVLLNANAPQNVASQTTVYDAFTAITGIAMACFGGFVIYACAVAFHFSHRVSAPMSKIVHCIEAYRRGDVRHHIEIGENDLLAPVADALLGLGAQMQQAGPDQPLAERTKP